GEAVEVAERRVPGPEVVDREADAAVAESGERVDRRGRVLHENTLGDLERERRRVDPRRGRRREDLREEARMLELARGQVDAHAEARLAEPVLPAPRLAARLVEHPPADRHDEPRVLGERDEVARHEQAPAGRLPAQERLDADDDAAREVDDRLVLEAKLVALDGTLDEA